MASDTYTCVANINTPDAQVDIEISGSTLKEGDLHLSIDNLSDLQFTIPAGQILNFKVSHKSQLIVHSLDAQLKNTEILLQYNNVSNKKSLEINFQGIKAVTNDLACSFE